jgi:hypothetical protein
MDMPASVQQRLRLEPEVLMHACAHDDLANEGEAPVHASDGTATSSAQGVPAQT